MACHHRFLGECVLGMGSKAGTFFFLYVTEWFLLNKAWAGRALAAGDAIQPPFQIHGELSNIVFPRTEACPFALEKKEMWEFFEYKMGL